MEHKTIYAKDLEPHMLLVRERQRVVNVEVGDRWVWVRTAAITPNVFTYPKFALIVVQSEEF